MIKLEKNNFGLYCLMGQCADGGVWPKNGITLTALTGVILTDGVAAKDGVRGHAGQTTASGIGSDDPELVHGALHQTGDVPVVAQWQRTDGVAVDTGPSLGSGLLLFYEVASDGGAAIIFGLFPVDSHGLQTDFSYSRLLTLTRNSCRTISQQSLIHPVEGADTVTNLYNDARKRDDEKS